MYAKVVLHKSVMSQFLNESDEGKRVRQTGPSRRRSSTAFLVLAIFRGVQSSEISDHSSDSFSRLLVSSESFISSYHHYGLRHFRVQVMLSIGSARWSPCTRHRFVPAVLKGFHCFLYQNSGIRGMSGMYGAY